MALNSHWIKIALLKDVRHGVHNLNLHLDEGESLAIFSPALSVHQFLFNIFMGHKTPEGGQLFIHQKLHEWGSVSFRKTVESIGLDGNSIGHDSFMAYEQFAMERDRQFRPFKVFKAWRQECQKAFDLAGISVSPTAPMSKLTHSERMLVVLAGVVYSEPKLLVLRDYLLPLAEATRHQAEVLIHGAQQRGTTVLWLHSQFQAVPNQVQRIVMIKDGHIILEQSATQLDRMELMRLFFAPESTLSQHLETPQMFYHLLRYNENILLDLPLSLFLLDTKGKIQLINHHAQSLLNIPHSSAILGQDIAEFFASLQPLFSSWLKEEIQSPTETTPSQFILALAQNTIHISSNLFPVTDQFGHIGYILLMEDRSKLEEYRNTAATNEILASTGLLAAGVAHEINNPLEIAKNYLNLSLKRSTSLEQTQALEAIGEELDQIHHIVGQLVSISSHGYKEHQNFCCIRLIKTLIHLLAIRCREKSISLHYTPSKDSLEMFGASSELRQIILNLIKNALESLPDRGSVTVISESFDQDDEGWVRIIVADDGPGIPVGSEKSIFHPFYSTKKNGSNMGLGLSITEGIVHKYKGSIRVENLAQGCRFIVELPRILNRHVS